MSHRLTARLCASLLSAVALGASGVVVIPAHAIGTPTASFTMSAASPQVNQSVTFDASGSEPSVPSPVGSIVSYAWDWNNDGTNDSVTSNAVVLRSFGARGQVTVKLTVTDDQDATAFTTKTFLVGTQAPTAAFTAPTTAYVDAAVPLDGTASSDPDAGDSLTYAWDWDNDGTVDASTPTTQTSYHVAGNYTVKLTVTDPAGVSNTKTQSISITNTAPTASFTVNPGSPSATQQVTFDASASGDTESPKTALTYAWSFGDGTTVTGTQAQAEVVTHTYTSGGSKTVTLTITDPQGVQGTSSKGVSVGANGAPSAVIAVDRDHANPGQVVSFDGTGSSDVETPDSVTLEWNFGDGSPTVTGSKAEVGLVEHSFANGDQTYVVQLKVTDAGNSSTAVTKPISVGQFAPTASYTATPSPVAVDHEVVFDGTASSDPEGKALTYAWSYTVGGGAPQSFGTTPTVQHTFHTGGTYSVSLRVTDPSGLWHTKTANLTVTNTAPTASAAATPTQPYQQAPVSFSAAGSSDVESPSELLTYEWDFDGDDTTDATGVTVEHVFTSVGPESVTLTLTDPHGGVGTDTVDLLVQPNGAPTADAGTPAPNPAHSGTAVVFDGAGSSDPDGLAGDSVAAYSWDFGDGTVPVTTAQASHAFAAAGVYDVTLTVADEHGAPDTATVQVTVSNTAPSAVAKATPNPVRVDHLVSFGSSDSNDADGDSLSYLWEFPNGSTATTASATRVFHAAGTYDVTLTVTDGFGGSDSDTVKVTVTNSAPTASVTASPAGAGVNKAIAFTAGGTDAETPSALAYSWSFGNGSTSTARNPSYTYTKPGIYTVGLTVTDPQGLQASASRTVKVVQGIACQSTRVARTGSWRIRSSASARGGSYCDNLGSASGTDSLTLGFTGPQVGLTFARATSGGKAKVYVDGVLKATIDFHSASATPRFGGRLTLTGLSAGKHKVRVVVTSGAAYVDDLLVWGPLT